MEIGIDIIEIERIEKAMKTHAFLKKVYSENERQWLAGKAAQSWAGVFAAKEALVKAGGGVLSDYEIGHEVSGKPIVKSAKGEFSISISHCEKYATAIAILQLTVNSEK